MLPFRFLVLGVVLPACSSCSTLTTKDQQEVATYTAEQSACVAATPGDKAAIDSCRAAVKAKWCSAWAGRFDSGVCQ
jgi:hypothetical protein